MKTGDLVTSSRLRDGVDCYDRAVVINDDPCVLVSKDGGMRWSSLPYDSLIKIDEQASELVLRRCMLRIVSDYVANDGSIDEKTFEIARQWLDNKPRTNREVFGDLMERYMRSIFGKFSAIDNHSIYWNGQQIIWLQPVGDDALAIVASIKHDSETEVVRVNLNETYVDTIKIYMLTETF